MRLLSFEYAALATKFFMEKVEYPNPPAHLFRFSIGVGFRLAGDLTHDIAGVKRAGGKVAGQFVMAYVAASVMKQAMIVMAQELADDVLEVLRTGAPRLRFCGKAGRFGRRRMFARFMMLARMIVRSGAAERFEFSLKGVESIVEGFEHVRSGLFSAKNVGGRGQGECRRVKLSARMFFEADLQVKPLGRKTFQMLFKPGDFQPKLALEFLVDLDVPRDDVPLN